MNLCGFSYWRQYYCLQVRAVCSCLGDTNVLVQRNALDFILQVLPLHSELIPRQLKGQLTKAGLEVLLRRDMSLNRRLYIWILGTNGNEAQNAKIHNNSVCSTEEHDGSAGHSYFSRNSRHLVTKAIKTLFQQQVNLDDIQSSTGDLKITLTICKNDWNSCHLSRVNFKNPFWPQSLAKNNVLTSLSVRNCISQLTHYDAHF